MLTECPNCEKLFRAVACPACGWTVASLTPTPSPATPADNDRWLCRLRPEGEPCRTEGCEHPGSTVVDRPNREAVAQLVATLTRQLGAVD